MSATFVPSDDKCIYPRCRKDGQRVAFPKKYLEVVEGITLQQRMDGAGVWMILCKEHRSVVKQELDRKLWVREVGYQ